MNRLNYFSPNWLIIKINNETVRDLLPQLHGRVIDLGCGTAPYRYDIQKVADEYIGVDWLNSAHDCANVRVVANLAETFPFRDCCADVVVSFQVLEHIPEPTFFLSECYRVLKPGGTIVLTIPFMWQVHEAPHDYFRYTKHGLTYLHQKCGFADIEIKETTGFWQMMALKVNYHTARFASGPARFFWVPLWWLDQVLSPILDHFDWRPDETASYTVLARRPHVS